MKLLTRMLLLLLAVSLALGLCACDKNKGDANDDSPTSTTTATETPPAPASYNVERLLRSAVLSGQTVLLTVEEGVNTYELTITKKNGTLTIGLSGETGMLTGSYAENAAGDVLLYVNAAEQNSAVYCAAADAADLRAAVRETLTVLFSGFDLATGGDCSAESCRNISFSNDKNSVEASFAISGDKVNLLSLEAVQNDDAAILTVLAVDDFSTPSFDEMKEQYASATETADEKAAASMVVVLRTLSRGGVMSGEVSIKNGIFTRTETVDRATVTPRIFGRTQQIVATIAESDGTKTAAMLTLSGGTWTLQTEHTKVHAGEDFTTTLKFLLSAVIGGIAGPGEETYDAASSDEEVVDSPCGGVVGTPDLPDAGGAASDLPFGFAPDGGVDVTCDGTTLHVDVTGLNYQKDETTTYVLSGKVDLTVSDAAQDQLPTDAVKSVDIDMDVLTTLLMQVLSVAQPVGGALRFDGEIALNVSFASLPFKLAIKYRYLTDDEGSSLHLVTPVLSGVTDAGVKDMIGNSLLCSGEVVTDTWKTGSDIFMRVVITVKYGNPFNPSSKTATSYYRFTEEEFQSDYMTVIAKAINLNEEAIKKIAGSLPSGGDPSDPGSGSGGGTTDPKPEKTPMEKLLSEQETSVRLASEGGYSVFECDFDTLAALAKELDPEADVSGVPEGAKLTIRIAEGDTLTSGVLTVTLSKEMNVSATVILTVLDVTTGTACPIAADQFTYLFPQAEA